MEKTWERLGKEKQISCYEICHHSSCSYCAQPHTSKSRGGIRICPSIGRRGGRVCLRRPRTKANHAAKKEIEKESRGATHDNDMKAGAVTKQPLHLITAPLCHDLVFSAISTRQNRSLLHCYQYCHSPCSDALIFFWLVHCSYSTNVATVLAQYSLPHIDEPIQRVFATVTSRYSKSAATVYILSQKSAATVNSPVKTPSRTGCKYLGLFSA